MESTRLNMNYNEIVDQLRILCNKIFESSLFEKDIYKDNIKLIKDVGMDSITFMSLIIEIEDYFNIIIPDDCLSMDDFDSVERIAMVVEKELNGEFKKK